MRRTDDLQFQGLVMIQDTELPRFTEDAVLLCNFLRLRRSDRVVDLGSGGGILCVLGQGKTGAAFVGVERQAALCELARESAEANGQQIPFYEADVADAPALLGHGSFSAAVCNPPYFTAGPASADANRAAARHGAADTLERFLRAAFLLLDNGGRFFVCYPAEHLCELFCALRAARLEPKRVQLVLQTAQKPPRLVLLEAQKDAKPGIRFEPMQILSTRG